MSLVFDKNRCIRCGTCIADCVCGIIAMGEDGFPALRKGAEGRCVQCGHCVAVCPAHAAILNGMDPALLPRAKELDGMEETLDNILKGRRAIRQYAGTSAPRELLEKAFTYAGYAPTAHNSRQVAYTVINGRDRVELLLEHLVRHMESHGLYPMHTASVRQGHDTLFRGAPCLILIHAPDRILSEADCATAASYLELALRGLGLGSCWAGMLVEACAPGLPSGFTLPEGHKLYAALMAGRPSVRYHCLPYRSAPDVTWQ